MIIRRLINFFTMRNLLFLGSLFLLLASGCAVRNAVLLHRSIPALGTITKVSSTSNDDEPFYKTTFIFHATDGKSYTITPELVERPAPYKVGDVVPVVYDAANPNGASISSYKEMWDFPVYFGSVGAVMLLVGLTLWRSKRSKNNPFTTRLLETQRNR